VSAEIPCEEGVLVAAEVLNNKSTYNTLELTSGRMAKVKRGDVVVGALGHRKALFGYSGHLPTELAPGDTMQLLNIGGVMGICDSVNPDFGSRSTAACSAPCCSSRTSASASACRPASAWKSCARMHR
jgi:hypothetical protein